MRVTVPLIVGEVITTPVGSVFDEIMLFALSSWRMLLPVSAIIFRVDAIVLLPISCPVASICAIAEGNNCGNVTVFEFVLMFITTAFDASTTLNFVVDAMPLNIKSPVIAMMPVSDGLGKTELVGSVFDVTS